MKYSMFLDDERFPVDDDRTWVIVRDFAQATECIHKNGWPCFISFDHDLGPDSLTGHDFAKWLVEEDLTNHTMPEDFSFYVHSQNPIGKHNIENTLNSYLEFKRNG